SIATVFGSSSALDGYPNARNHAVALLSRCHRIYTTFRDLDPVRMTRTASSGVKTLSSATIGVSRAAATRGYWKAYTWRLSVLAQGKNTTAAVGAILPVPCNPCTSLSII